MTCSRCLPNASDPQSSQNVTSCINLPLEPTILLVGNPNVGKSTLFNALTGSKQVVMNAPGTTVEVKVGRWAKGAARVVDLPGTYSLIAQSPDEQMVADNLAGVPGSFTDPSTGRSVDLVVCVLDATAPTRSLYLLGQVAKTGRPVVALLTFQDVARKDAGEVDADGLSRVLGIPTMSLDPRRNDNLEDIEQLLDAGLRMRPRVQGIAPDPLAPGYNQVAAASASASTQCNVPSHMACQVECYCDKMGEGSHVAADSTAALGAEDQIERATNLFSWVNSVESDLGSIQRNQGKLSASDKTDRILLNPFVGVPVFFLLMWLLFMVAGQWVGPVQDFFEDLFTSQDAGAFSLANGIDGLLQVVGWNYFWLQGVLIGGLATGLGVVASFFPLMFVIFLMITLLEDSGYMARAAFMGDRLMRKLGLDGRVILPLIMGFGCNLPSLAAARSLPNVRQRVVTVLITPYTSCAARLTIYLMIARIFFPKNTGTIIFVLYVLSLAMVILGALVLKPFFTKDQGKAPLMLVLPPYGIPIFRATVTNAWSRSWAFVRGAGKIIVAMTAVVWLLGAIPVDLDYSFADPQMPMSASAYGRTARALEPVFKPAGFGDWHMTGALMTGFVAKETVISSIVVSYNMDPEAVGDAEQGGTDLGQLPKLVESSFENAAGAMAPLGAFAFLVFVLTYTPCLATVAEQARQIGARLTLIALAVQLFVAWLLSVGVFQVGRLLF